MRTNIVIDPALMSAALKTSGLPSKRQAVEAGLRLLSAEAGTGQHPAYEAWQQLRRKKTAVKRAAGKAAGERSSDAFRAALLARYRP